MTVLEEIIKDFTELAKKEGDSGFVGRSVLAIINNKNWLEKEKQQIIMAHEQGRSDKHNDFSRDGEKYYSEVSDSTCH